MIHGHSISENNIVCIVTRLSYLVLLTVGGSISDLLHANLVQAKLTIEKISSKYVGTYSILVLIQMYPGILI